LQSLYASARPTIPTRSSKSSKNNSESYARLNKALKQQHSYHPGHKILQPPSAKSQRSATLLKRRINLKRPASSTRPPHHGKRFSGKAFRQRQMINLNKLKSYLLKRIAAPQKTRYKSPSNISSSKTTKFKLNMVKNIWLVTGLFMIAVPLIQWILPASMLATFLSFMILDEAQ